MSDNLWHQVAITYDQADGGLVSLYIDGKLDSSNPNNGGWSWPAAQEVEIGLSHDSYWRPYNGLLDDVRIYNRALADTEVASVASSDALVETGALVERLNFDAKPASGVSISWKSSDAVLQSSSTVNGPYTDVAGATSPYSIEAGSGNMFYRYTHTTVSILSNPYDM